MELKVREVGNSLGVVFPKEALIKMNAGKGQKLYLTEMPDGAFKIGLFDPDFDEQIKAARVCMKEYANTLKALAE